MSQWTHVCGCVRIDGVFDREGTDVRIKEVFGKILRWESEGWMWDEQENYPELYTPTGSEGGIEYYVHKNSDTSCADSHAVCIIGDLRDYDDVGETINWFNKICQAFPIRDAVLNIDVEYQRTVTLIYNGDNKPCRIIEKQYEREVM